MASEKITFDGRKLSRRTAIKGLLRSELAAAAKITQFTLSRCFAGKPVRVRTARQVAKALGSTISKLITEEPPPLADRAKGEARVA